MTNYIAYILLVRIKSSPTLSQLYGDNFDLKAADENDNEPSEFLRKLAREIYLESETEPCGLKGCKLSIFLEADQSQSNQQQSQQLVESQPVNYLLTQFMFDSTSSLTTFELNLFLKQKPGGAVSHTGRSNEEATSSSFATLTKRLLSKTNSNSSSSKSSTLTKSNYPNTSHQADFHIYIDPTNPNLFKCKLY